MKASVANDYEAGIVGNLCPFVKIQGNRIRPLDSRETRRQIRRQNRKSSEDAIDVEPQLFPMRDVGKPREIVDGADIDRSGRSDDKR
jgi:hypothetical protein